MWPLTRAEKSSSFWHKDRETRQSKIPSLVTSKGQILLAKEICRGADGSMQLKEQG